MVRVMVMVMVRVRVRPLASAELHRDEMSTSGFFDREPAETLSVCIFMSAVTARVTLLPFLFLELALPVLRLCDEENVFVFHLKHLTRSPGEGQKGGVTRSQGWLVSL